MFGKKKDDKPEPEWKKKQRLLEEKEKKAAQKKKEYERKNKAKIKAAAKAKKAAEKAAKEPAWKQKKRDQEAKEKKAKGKQKDAERKKKDALKLKSEAHDRKLVKDAERKKTVEKARLSKAKTDALKTRAKRDEVRKRTDRLMGQTVNPFSSGLREAEGFSVGKLLNKVFGTVSVGATDIDVSKMARAKAKRRVSKKELQHELTEEERKALTRKRTTQLLAVLAILSLAIVYLVQTITIPDRSEPLHGSYVLKKYLVDNKRVACEGELHVSKANFSLKLIEKAKPGKKIGKVTLLQKGPWKATGPYVKAVLGGWKWIYSFKGNDREYVQLEIFDDNSVKILLFKRQPKKS